MSLEYPAYLAERMTVDLPKIYKSHPGLGATIQKIGTRKDPELAYAAELLALTGRDDIIAEAIEDGILDDGGKPISVSTLQHFDLHNYTDLYSFSAGACCILIERGVQLGHFPLALNLVIDQNAKVLIDRMYPPLSPFSILIPGSEWTIDQARAFPEALGALYPDSHLSTVYPPGEYVVWMNREKLLIYNWLNDTYPEPLTND
jgi:hypothetical protein